MKQDANAGNIYGRATSKDRRNFLLAIVFFLFAAFALTYRQIYRPSADVIAGVTPAQVIGSRQMVAIAEADYVVVEFGDYECPPCRAVQPRLLRLVRSSHVPLRLAFRHYPLTELHPHALELAVLAERARLAGKFDEVHEYLYRAAVNDETIGIASRRFELGNGTAKDLEVAKAAVWADREQAKRLQIDSTPTFLLCRPNGTVERTSLTRLEHEFGK